MELDKNKHFIGSYKNVFDLGAGVCTWSLVAIHVYLNQGKSCLNAAMYSLLSGHCGE